MTSLHRRSLLNAVFVASTSLTLPRDAVSQTAQPNPRNPVFYWNEHSLRLIILDHSIAPADEAVAPGPCASAKALGIIHAVIADAVSHVYPSPRFEALFNRNKPTSIGSGDPALFVGGAAWSYIRYIFYRDRYSEPLERVKRDFLSLFPGDPIQNKRTWDAGIQFGSAQEFRRLWNAQNILNKLRDQNYKPQKLGDHNVDPWNPGQGFYGLRWDEEAPLVLNAADIRRFAENDLKAAPEISQDELDYLIAKGSRTPRSTGNYSARRDPQERNVGLFWAYDGAAWVGVPPVLYNQAIVKVAQADNLTAVSNIPRAARLFAICNLAMADASIVCWEAKWRIALWRPVLAIQALTGEENWQPYGSPRSNPDGSRPSAPEVAADIVEMLRVPVAGFSGDTAQTLLGASPSASFDGPPDRRPPSFDGPPDPEYARAAFTPNFPSYPSGHATFGGSCFKALFNVRAESRSRPNSVSLILRSTELNGITRDNYGRSRRPNRPESFARLLQVGVDRRRHDLDSFAGANDVSRIFLGVHWSFDATDGDLAGRKVGDLVSARAYQLR
jgi:hypothetical protein